MQVKTNFYIKNFGCKVNQYDSRLIAQNLESMGKTGVSSPQEADIIIVNTCSVTNRSESKERSYMRKISRRYPEKEFLTVGCTVRRYKGDFKYGGAETSTGFIYLNNPRTALEKFKGHSRGFITIQQGCRGGCAYCLVKKLKKPYFIKSPSEVVAEARRFLKNHGELVFCATNSAEYTKLGKLIKELHDIPGEFRWRFSSLNPRSLTEENIKLLSRDKRFCPHFHIPLQSASDSVLKRMNRGYNLETVESVIDTIKRYVPRAVFAFDIIVGFPGESEKDFRNTVDFIEKIRPIKVHVFRFSNCEGTEAYKFKNIKRVDESAKRKRLEILKTISGQIRSESLESAIGTLKEVVPEKGLRGYTRDYLPVAIYGETDKELNDLQKVRIIGKEKNRLSAVIE